MCPPLSHLWDRGRKRERQTDSQTVRQSDSQTVRQTDGRTDGQRTDMQTDRQTNRQRQTDRQTDRWADGRTLIRPQAVHMVQASELCALLQDTKLEINPMKSE